MMRRRGRRLLLAIAAASHGLGYAVFLDPATPVDWGVKEVRSRDNAACVAQADRLFRRYEPAALVLEDATAPGSRRRPRIRALIEELTERALECDVPAAFYARSEVSAVIAPGVRANKDDLAERVVALVPALAPRLPQRRRPWESERYAMAIFDAAALALTHYACAQAQ